MDAPTQPGAHARSLRAARRHHFDRPEWLAKQAAIKEAQRLRRTEAEERGRKWLLVRQAMLIELRTLDFETTRHPLGRWAKGKVWAKNAETYV